VIYSILIIDDDPIIQRVVAAMLWAESLRIKTASSVSEGLALIEQEKPDLVICDMVMPNISGLDFLQHCRQTPDLATMPVIVITGSSGQHMIEQALIQGAFACLSKPFSKPQIADTVRMALRQLA
jgi:CheY-like chemotaxis protein